MTKSEYAGALPRGGGEKGDRIRAFDWTQHPFGPPETWPPTLLTTLGICLTSSFPTAIYWGPELRLLYNDAWSVIPAERHPWALGRTAREVWHDIWDVVGEQFEAVLEQGVGFSTYDQMLPIERGGAVQETYWNYSITPILDANGKVAGIFNQGNETTANIFTARAIAAEADRLRETFAQAPGAIAILRGPQHKFESANAAYIDLIGGRPDIVGKPVAEALPEVVAQGFIELLNQVRASGEPYEGRGVPVGLNREGVEEERVIDFIYQPMRDASGAVDGIFVQVTDRTERARIEKERAFFDELARATQFLTDADAVLGVTTELTGKFLKASVCAYADMDEDEDGFTIRGDWAAPGSRSIVGRYSLRDFGALAVGNLRAGTPLVINDNRTEIKPEEAEAFQSIGITATLCMPLVRDGKLTALMAVHHKDKHAWTPEEFAIIRAVTQRSWAHVERVRAEKEAQESAQRYRTLFNSIDEGFCVIEFFDGPHGPLSDYVHVEANEAYTLNAGIPDVVGQKVREMVPDEADGWVELYRNVLLTGKPIRFEKELEATGRWLELAAFRIEPAERKQVAVLFKDLSARKQAEDALQALNATLETRVTEEVAERTRAEEQLRQAQKMEAIGHLTGGIAHDFNNMLAVVIGSLNLMQRRLKAGDTAVTRYVDAAVDGATRAAALTQRLLAFSRQQALEPRAIEVNKLVGAMSELLARTLGEHIRIETVQGAGVWRCFADPVQLESAVLNLAVNARDAMPEGGKLTIETQNALVDEKVARNYEMPEGQYVVITVTDTGSGMSAEVMAQAFDPFFTTKDVGKGTGLGLSQVFGFIRQSGGHVKLYSEIGVGTAVKLYLPRFSGAAQQGEDLGAGLALATGTQSETVLVVEDEERVRNYSIEALMELGYNVAAAKGPVQALQMIQSGVKVHLLFTDIVMPDMNGRQLADAARKLLPDLKVLFTTGYTRNAIVHNGVLDVGTTVLQKPFTIDQLALKIRTALDS